MSSGNIINPFTGEMINVKQAVEKGIISKSFAASLNSDKNTIKQSQEEPHEITLFQAMEKVYIHSISIMYFYPAFLLVMDYEDTTDQNVGKSYRHNLNDARWPKRTQDLGPPYWPVVRIFNHMYSVR